MVTNVEKPITSYSEEVIKEINVAIKVFKLTEYELDESYPIKGNLVKMKHKNCGELFLISRELVKTQNICRNCYYKNGRLKKRISDFKEVLLNLTNNEYQVSEEIPEDKIINMHTPIDVIHNIATCGRTYQTTYNDFLKGKRCIHCKNKIKKKKLQERLDKEHINQYKVLGDFVKGSEPIKIKHYICGNEFLAEPNKIGKQTICPHCKKRAKHVKYTTEEFQNIVFELIGTSFRVESEYTYSNIPIKIYHADCDSTFTTTPTYFKMTKRCPICQSNNFKKRLTTDEYKTHVRYLNKEIKVLGEYSTARTPTLHQHICGYEFNITPVQFKSNPTCPQCKQTKNIKSKKLDDLKSVLSNLLDNDYELLEPIKNENIKVHLKHSCGYEFLMPPYRLIRGETCPKCNGDVIEPKDFENEVLSRLSENFKFLTKYKTEKDFIFMQHTTCGSVFKDTARKLRKLNKCPICKGK